MRTDIVDRLLTSARSAVALGLVIGAMGCCSIKTCATYETDANTERFGIRATFVDVGQYRYVVILGNLKDHIPFAADTGHRHALAFRIPVKEASSEAWTSEIEGVMVTFKFKHPDVTAVTAADLMWTERTKDKGRLSGSITLHDPQSGHPPQVRIQSLAVTRDAEAAKPLQPRTKWREYQRLLRDYG